MSSWHPLGPSPEIPPTEGRSLLVAGVPIALFQVDGQYHAIDDLCPHAGASLGAGCLKGHVVTCPVHGWTYDVRSGQPPVGRYEPVNSYPLRLEGETLMIALDD